MKIKLPRLSKLFVRKKRTLRLSTARRASASGAEFDEMSEPNMKLSRALLIVLLLHIVAVGGIIAFNAIKSRQGATVAAVTTARAQASPSATAEIKHSLALKTEKRSIPESARVYTVARGDTPVTIAKKFKVPYDDLLAANHVDDPRKLKIGQKLIIPAKAMKTKKGSE
jgi:LysM repeat protein